MPTRAATDKVVDDRLSQPFSADANDTIYQYLASRNFDPELGAIRARVLAINSADDERNPAELAVTAKAVAKLKSSRYYEVPASAETRGHSTVAQARFWSAQLAEFLAGK